jgi:hypothetical protein
VNQINQAADAAHDVLRISMDAKATVKIGPFARGGKPRVHVDAADHDFAPEATVTPVGIFLPTMGELFVYGVISKVTSDCLVDRLAQWWDRDFVHVGLFVAGSSTDFRIKCRRPCGTRMILHLYVVCDGYRFGSQPRLSTVASSRFAVA